MKMKANVDQLFSLQPKTAFEVRRTEVFREKSASAEYSPGSLMAQDQVFFMFQPQT